VARTLLFPFLGFLAGTALTFLVLVVGHSYGYVSGFVDPAKQVELLAVYLGAATLAVAAVAVGVALFGIMGYALIKAEAISAATRAGAAAGEKAIAPLLQRELLVRRFGTMEPQEEDLGLDPLTQALARKE
jgi:hypothetical protein